jgi:glycosyltransferase involved in cell wall biosynthesis
MDLLTNMKAFAGKTLMFVENAYPQDTRVKNEADALTEAGYVVTVICLRKQGQSPSEVVNGVQVYRLPRVEFFQKTPVENPTVSQRVWLKVKSLFGYVSEYVYFTSACFVMSVYVAFKHGFDVIHAHNPPDTLWLVALPWKLVGKKYIFDHHDLCPELYQSRFGADHDLFSTVLQWVEWGNLKLATRLIATNESYKQIQIERGGRKPEDIFVVRNGPNRMRMQPSAASPRLRAMGKTILVYVGSLNPQDGVDYLLRALKHLVYDLKREDFFCVIMGSGDSLQDLRDLARTLKLEPFVELTGWISDADLQANLAAADICMDPDPSSPLNNVSTWIKVMEYMAHGKPIVTFDLKETRYSAQDAAIYVPCNDEVAFAAATAALMDSPELREKMGRFGRERVEKELQWSVVSRNLVSAYEALHLRRTSKMQNPNIGGSLAQIDRWVEQANWKAYDTFDGLSSPYARHLTFNHPLLKIVWQQGVRRFPLNLRPLLGVKPAMSTKAMGFFAQGYLRLFQTHGQAEHLEKMRFCLDWLIQNRSPGFKGFCWGNHFDYQHRAGNIPRGTPTIVWTGLIGHAFLDAFEALGETSYLEVARKVGECIANELGHMQYEDTVYLNYYPGATHFVHNSNMIGASLLARVHHHVQTEQFGQMSRQAVRWTMRHQLSNGAWYYGVGPKFQWVDSFHTGYVLEALDCYIRYSGDQEYMPHLQKGYRFYLETFFGADGTPYYYDKKMRPLDIQCSSQGIQTLVNLSRFDARSLNLAVKVADWTLKHMYDRTGFFYYRKYPLITNKTPTMHWGQATMFAALATLDQRMHNESKPETAYSAVC